MIFPNLVLIMPFSEFLDKKQKYKLKRSLQVFQPIEFVFLNILIFYLLFLEQYLNSY